MINHYEIRNSNKEEILVLYLDISEEFSLDFKNNDKYKEFKYQLKKIIEVNRFTGQKIILVVGSVIIGSLLFLSNSVDKESLDNYVFVDNSIAILNEVKLEDKVMLNKNDNDEIEANTEINIEIVEDKINNDQKLGSNLNIDTTLNNNYSNNVNNNDNNEETVEIKEEVVEPTVEEKKVTIYRSNGSIVTLTINEYLIGVVGAEMPASFNIEALKAQAVLARTYAFRKIERNEKLTDTVSTQRYKDNNELRSMWGNDFDKYYSKIKNAVEATDGITLKYNGSYIEAVYHSTSNGKTEDAVNVWGNNVSYLKSVDSRWDEEASSYLRTENKDLSSILNILGITTNDVAFEIISRNESGRVESIKVGNNIFSGIEFRTLLGLRSTDFDVNVINNEIVITTRGYGHGVGMSQYGANGMAKEGYNYGEILNHYYPGTYQDYREFSN